MLTQEQFSHLIDECKYTASRSSGPGGQHVNKVNTRMELRFNIGTSQVLSQEQKVLIRKNLASRISLQDDIIMACQTHRSQLQNKLLVTEDFVMLIQKALIVPKKRVKTKPGKAAVQKRLDQKKKLAEKKSLRGKFRL